MLKLIIVFKGLTISAYISSESFALQLSVAIFYPILLSAGMSILLGYLLIYVFPCTTSLQCVNKTRIRFSIVILKLSVRPQPAAGTHLVS